MRSTAPTRSISSLSHTFSFIFERWSSVYEAGIHDLMITAIVMIPFRRLVDVQDCRYVLIKKRPF